MTCPFLNFAILRDVPADERNSCMSKGSIFLGFLATVLISYVILSQIMTEVNHCLGANHGELPSFSVTAKPDRTGSASIPPQDYECDTTTISTVLLLAKRLAIPLIRP
jgi:hypothetical protein